MTPQQTKKITKKQAVHQLWRYGHLSWKLDKNQKELYDLYHKGKQKINTWLLARRSGKSHTLLVLALEVCLKNANSIVKYIAPTKLQVKTIIEPLLQKLCEDAPADLKPRFNTKEYCYYFLNGSKIELAGGDNGHAEKLRGSDAHLVIVDEAGSIEDLDYIVTSILLPTTLITKGKLLLASTPPRYADHHFNKFIEKAEDEGILIKKTIYDNPRLTEEDIQQQINECGGINAESFQREYLCNKVKDPSLSVIPEFDDYLEKEIVKEWVKPPFFDAYVAMDLGFKDLTVVVFGYYDFKSAKVVIEDEIVVNFQDPDMNLPKLTEAIIQKEKQLWTNILTNEVQKPVLRVSDVNHIVTGEISRASKRQLTFSTPVNRDNDADINHMRVLLSSRKVMINPRCKTVIKHLKNVKWQSDKNKKTFARSPDSGHYDAVDAVKYLLKAVNYNKNPFPALYDYNPTDLYVANPKHIYQNHQPNSYAQAFKQIFEKNKKPWRANVGFKFPR